jgi:uncharacterized membrane protein
MLSLPMFVLFIHIVSVIVALGGSLFTTFALMPILGNELDPASRVQVTRRVIRRLGGIVLTALALLVFTGILNVLFTRIFSALLVIKLVLVAVVIVLATYQYANLGARIWRLSDAGPRPELAALQRHFRRIGLTVGTLVLLIVYISLGLTRAGPVVSASGLQ